MVLAGPRPNRYLPTLDGWRAVAIVWVMVYHDAFALFAPGGLYPNPALFRVANEGHFGVDIFFGISGFLICSRLLNERSKYGRIDLKDFWIRRGFRILPPLWAFLGVVALAGLTGLLTVNPWAWFSGVTFWRNYLPDSLGGGERLLAYMWTLAVEEHFYLLWPVLLVVLGARRAGWTAVVLGLLIAAWRTIDLRYGAHPSWLNGGSQRTDLRMDGLLFGAAMAIVFDDGRRREWLRRTLTPWVWVVLTASLLLITVGITVTMLRLWVSVSVPVLLVGTVLYPDAVPGRVLEWGPLRWVGRLSYSLYLWQQVFLSALEWDRPFSPLRAFPLNWVAALACALVSYYLIERPAIAWGRRVSARRKERLGVRIAPVAIQQSPRHEQLVPLPAR